MARLVHVNGAVVTAPDEKVNRLLAAGFRVAEPETKRAPAKRASKKSANSSSAIPPSVLSIAFFST